MTILTSATLAALITSNNCGSPVVALVMVGISRHESGLVALAIYDNVTERRYAPTSTAEAVRTASSLLGLGHSFDAGIAQVNSKNWAWIGLSPPEAVFDPCRTVVGDTPADAEPAPVMQQVDLDNSQYCVRSPGNAAACRRKDHVQHIDRHASVWPSVRANITSGPWARSRDRHLVRLRAAFADLDARLLVADAPPTLSDMVRDDLARHLVATVMTESAGDQYAIGVNADRARSALRRLQMERGLSQRQMAAPNGLNQNVISAAERGKTNTSLVMMARLAHAVGGDVPTMLTKQE